MAKWPNVRAEEEQGSTQSHKAHSVTCGNLSGVLASTSEHRHGSSKDLVQPLACCEGLDCWSLMKSESLRKGIKDER